MLQFAWVNIAELRKKLPNNSDYSALFTQHDFYCTYNHVCEKSFSKQTENALHILQTQVAGFETPIGLYLIVFLFKALTSIIGCLTAWLEQKSAPTMALTGQDGPPLLKKHHYKWYLCLICQSVWLTAQARRPHHWPDTKKHIPLEEQGDIYANIVF